MTSKTSGPSEPVPRFEQIAQPPDHYKAIREGIHAAFPDRSHNALLDDLGVGEGGEAEAEIVQKAFGVTIDQNSHERQYLEGNYWQARGQADGWNQLSQGAAVVGLAPGLIRLLRA